MRLARRVVARSFSSVVPRQLAAQRTRQKGETDAVCPGIFIHKDRRRENRGCYRRREGLDW